MTQAMTQAERMQAAILSGIRHQTDGMVSDNDVKGLKEIAVLLRDYAHGMVAEDNIIYRRDKSELN